MHCWHIVVPLWSRRRSAFQNVLFASLGIVKKGAGGGVSVTCPTVYCLLSKITFHSCMHCKGNVP